MPIPNVLLEIKRISVENHLSEPFIVGGLPRDKILGLSKMIDDVDITTGDSSIDKLVGFCSNKFGLQPLAFEDGHKQLIIQSIKYDFSSNFRSPDVEYFLTQKAKIKNPSQMQLELFSRDFTCNTLILPMNLRSVKDLTGMGINDIKKKILRTPLPPRITLRDDPRRVIRAIYLAAKLDFEIEPDIILWAKNHPEQIKQAVKPGFSRRKLASAAKYNIQKSIHYIKEMNLFNVVAVPSIIQQQYFG
jgi:tRNA nucleotidyltransferase (CCA-adding enzyme)